MNGSDGFVDEYPCDDSLEAPDGNYIFIYHSSVVVMFTLRVSRRSRGGRVGRDRSWRLDCAEMLLAPKAMCEAVRHPEPQLSHCATLV